MASRFFCVLLVFLVAGCGGGGVRLVDIHGKTIDSQRRMPLYNRQMIEMQTKRTLAPSVQQGPENEIPSQALLPVNRGQAVEEIPVSRSRVGSTAGLEDSGILVPPGSAMAENRKMIKTPEPNREAEDMSFVPISKISLNENKNLEYKEKILLNRQNIMTDNEYSGKTFTTPKPIKNRGRVSSVKKKQHEKQEAINFIPVAPKRKPVDQKKPAEQAPVEKKLTNRTDAVYFVTTLEQDSIMTIGDKIRDIKPLTDRVVSIEKDKQDGYSVIIGPMESAKEATALRQKLVANGYLRSVVVER